MATVDQLLFALTLLAALGCGLIAGVFFAFSAFVMKALARLPPGEGIAAMQSVNVAVLNPSFMAAFLGTAATCVLALISSLLRWHEPGAAYLFVGGALYLVGSLLVTIVFNVPKNQALASVAPADPDGASLWAGYVTSWTARNHVRTAAPAQEASTKMCTQKQGAFSCSWIVREFLASRNPTLQPSRPSPTLGLARLPLRD